MVEVEDCEFNFYFLCKDAQSIEDLKPFCAVDTIESGTVFVLYNTEDNIIATNAFVPVDGESKDSVYIPGEYDEFKEFFHDWIKKNGYSLHKICKITV